MNSSRLLATLMVLLIAFSYCIGVRSAWAEGPFDVDDPGGNGRSRTHVIGGDSGSGDGSDGNENALRSGSGTTGGDWFTSLVLRVSFDLLFDHFFVISQSPTTTAPATSGSSANRKQ